MIDAIGQYFIPSMINTLVVIYILAKVFEVKVNYKTFEIYLIPLLMTLLSIINFIYIDNFVRFFTSTLYTVIGAKILFKKPIHKVIAAVLIEQIIMFVSELIYMLFIILLLNLETSALFDYIKGALITNLLVSLIAFILINMRPINKICNKIMNYIDRIKQKNKYVLAFTFLITLNVLLVIMYINSKNMIMVIVNVVFMIIYSGVVFLLLNEKNQNIIVKEENKNLLDNLNEYEKMLDYQRIANHENKNQLLVIKGMINKNNKKLQSYIDEIIKEKREDSETLYAKARRIPSGGLQGLIYQKMLRMHDKNINMDLNISSDVRKIDLSELNAKTNYDICRAIGIIIDNAVDETLKFEDKEISISMYKDNDDFVIEVANKCKDLPDLDKISSKGYTTKDAGHGYGLSLLKNICDNNKDIINQRTIIGNIFTQIIKIKM